MHRMTGRIVLFLLLFLAVIGAIFMIMRTPDEDGNSPLSPGFSIREENQTQYPDQAPIPAPAENITTPSAVQATPEPTAPPPTPTPYVPTPTPEPVILPLGNGSIESGRALLLNIHADWNASTAGDDYAQVQVVVYADHYALTYGNEPKVGLTIRLGDDSHRMDAAPVNASLNQPQSTELGRYAFSVPLKAGESVSLPLSCEWEFNGTYVNFNSQPVEIYGISCEGNVNVSR